MPLAQVARVVKHVDNLARPQLLAQRPLQHAAVAGGRHIVRVLLYSAPHHSRGAQCAASLAPAGLMQCAARATGCRTPR